MADSQLNRGVFNFMTKQGYNIHDMRRVLNYYAVEKGIQRPKKGRLKWYTDVSFKASEDFETFKKVFNANKLKRQKPKSYEEEWNESNLNGDFAYNGVTDDF